MADPTETPEEIVHEYTDVKGRPNPYLMPDHDLILELVITMRALQDTMDEVTDSPMIKTMMGGSGGNIMSLLGGGR